MRKVFITEQILLNYLFRHKQATIASIKRLNKHFIKYKHAFFALIFVVLILSSIVANIIYDNLTFENRFASQIKHSGTIVDVANVRRVTKVWLLDGHGNKKVFYGGNVSELKPYIGKHATIMSYRGRSFFYLVENHIASLQVDSKFLVKAEKIKLNNDKGRRSGGYMLMIGMLLFPLVIIFVLTFIGFLNVYFFEFSKTSKYKRVKI